MLEAVVDIIISIWELWLIYLFDVVPVLSGMLEESLMSFKHNPENREHVPNSMLLQ